MESGFLNKAISKIEAYTYEIEELNKKLQCAGLEDPELLLRSEEHLKESFAQLDPSQLENAYDAICALSRCFNSLDWVLLNKNDILKEDRNARQFLKRAAELKRKSKSDLGNIDDVQLKLQNAFKAAVAEKCINEPQHAARLKKLPSYFPGSE